MDSPSTNDDLAKEIASYLNGEPDTFTLELPGSFEFREGVVTCLLTTTTSLVGSTNELVVARAVSISRNPPIDNPVKVCPNKVTLLNQGLPSCLVFMPALYSKMAARLSDASHAQASPDVLFRMHFDVKALVQLDWISEVGMIEDGDDDCCDFLHVKGIACSAMTLDMDSSQLSTTD